MAKILISLLVLSLILNPSFGNGSLHPYQPTNQEAKLDEHCSADECKPSKLDRQECDLLESIQAFRRKRLIRAKLALETDPYDNGQLDADEERLLRSVVESRRINCGLRYVDSERIEYTLRTFPNEHETSKFGFAITHYGRCGACSSLHDLSLYLATHANLTVLARQCAAFTLVSDRLSAYCFWKLGFSESCAQIWLYSSKHTRRHCWWTCLKSWIIGEPMDESRENSTLNACLQCDEDYSGLIFKYYAGRTRSNSGIRSAIGRPKGEIRDVTHCYY